MGRGLASVLLASLACSPLMVAAADDSLKVDSRDNILKSAGTVAKSLMDEYNKGEIPGLLSDEYYFFESGTFMSTLVDYWHLTGDSTYNDAVKKGLLYQVGAEDNFMPANQSANLGNDDQCFWALAAMQAAENNFTSPSSDEPQWLTLAKNVFNDQAQRLDAASDTCGGGLRWQIFTFNAGWDYKNSISNGCFFDLGARLARHTGNATYSKTVVAAYDWLEKSALVNGTSGVVYDGTTVAKGNCSNIDKVEWSYVAAILNNGAAYMYNQTTGDDQKKWQDRVQKFTDSILSKFFPSGIAYEPACETVDTCSVDQVTFKGIAIRWLAAVSQLAPFTADKILPVLKTSAEAAAKSCTSSSCSFSWNDTNVKGPKSSGIGERLNALAAISNLLIADASGPSKGSENATESTGSSPSQTSGSSQASSSTDKGAAGKGMGLSVALLTTGLLASTWMGLGF
ncbi:unnamed protein product [Clonostachys chloroleuca]|uniref:Mannan endo-1,6-alpha-mannosidase n=1 Tax=Clonostachys chloroleuca TaxID=1926264 RepID=A0AA35QCZ2_9HYPO|nr:unnamed protein product [Clonostachys chloroleuca]